MLTAFSRAKVSSSLSSVPSRQKHTLPNVQHGAYFPNISVRDSRTNVRLLHSLFETKRSPLIVFQPGASHPLHWRDKEDSYREWLLMPGAKGCGEQLSNYARHYAKYVEADVQLICVLSNPSSADLLDIETIKALPFDLYSLTPESVAHLKRLGLPHFEFDGQIYFERQNFLLGQDMSIKTYFNRRSAKPEQEAEQTLADLVDQNLVNALSRVRL